MFYGVWSFLKYFLFSIKFVTPKNSFLYQFKNEVLASKMELTLETQIAELRNFYQKENLDLQNEDYGAGARNKKIVESINTRYLSKNVAVSKKYGRVLYQLSKHLKAQKVLELGTSLGIGSAYLSKSELISIEGNSALHQYTKQTLASKGFNNIQLVNAKFDDVLEDLIAENQFDLIYIDGNHTFEATIRYFELFAAQKNTVIIFDDIYWTKDMTKAWNYIKKDKKVDISVDLFKFGIAFIQDSTAKQDYRLWY